MQVQTHRPELVRPVSPSGERAVKNHTKTSVQGQSKVYPRSSEILYVRFSDRAMFSSLCRHHRHSTTHIHRRKSALEVQTGVSPDGWSLFSILRAHQDPEMGVTHREKGKCVSTSNNDVMHTTPHIALADRFLNNAHVI